VARFHDFGLYCEAILFRIGDGRRGTPERKSKATLTNFKIRTFKESIPDWMDELGVKELGEPFGPKKLQLKPTCESNFKSQYTQNYKKNYGLF
jgi:hypothetical protein